MSQQEDIITKSEWHSHICYSISIEAMIILTKVGVV